MAAFGFPVKKENKEKRGSLKTTYPLGLHRVSPNSSKKLGFGPCPFTGSSR